MTPASSLEGILVADFSRVLAGPLAAMTLGDLGADVIKVGSPPGTRRGPGAHREAEDGTATYFLAVNRTSARSRSTSRTTRRRARPRARPARRRPRRQLQARGARAPRARAASARRREPAVRPLLDHRLRRRGAAPRCPATTRSCRRSSGLMSNTGPGRGTRRSRVALGDVIAGLGAAVAILAALTGRERSGGGQRIEIDLLSSALAASPTRHRRVYAGAVPTRLGTSHPSIEPFATYAAADCPLMICAGNASIAALAAVSGVRDRRRCPLRRQRGTGPEPRRARRLIEGRLAADHGRVGRCDCGRRGCRPGPSTTSPAPSSSPRVWGSSRSTSTTGSAPCAPLSASAAPHPPPGSPHPTSTSTATRSDPGSPATDGAVGSARRPSEGEIRSHSHALLESSAREWISPRRPQAVVSALEQRVLERWRETDVFARQLSRRRDAAAPVWSFYEGPPTANGKPGAHHVLSRVFKDVYPRYRAMRGYYVPRKAGWDCHGLPVELEVEKELGISSKAEIEEYGIAEFNARCRESVFRYVEEWNRMTERIGYWIDLDDPYVTLDNEYIESVWWSLRRLWDAGLLYEGHKVVPYCPRCGTALSSHEVAVGYRDVEDPSVYVRFPVVEVAASDEIGASPVEVGDSLVAWTTTPWTLISNAALAVGDRDRVRARTSRRRGPDPRPRPGRGGARRGRRGTRALPRRGARRDQVRAPVRLHHRLRATRPHRPRGRLRDHRGRHRDRPHRDRIRRGRFPARRAVRDHAPEPGASRRHFRRAGHRLRRASPSSRPTRRSSRRCGRADGCCAPRPTSTPIRTAGAAARRCSTTRSRAGTSARPRSATGCWRRTSRSAGIPSTSSTDGSESGSRATSTGRCRASATGARRCQSGAASRSIASRRSAQVRSPTSEGAGATRRTTCIARTSTTSCCAAMRAGARCEGSRR